MSCFIYKLVVTEPSLFPHSPGRQVGFRVVSGQGFLQGVWLPVRGHICSLEGSRFPQCQSSGGAVVPGKHIPGITEHGAHIADVGGVVVIFLSGHSIIVEIGSIGHFLQAAAHFRHLLAASADAAAGEPAVSSPCPNPKDRPVASTTVVCASLPVSPLVKDALWKGRKDS